MRFRNQDDFIKFSGLLLLFLLLLASHTFGASNAMINNQEFITLSVLDSFYFSFDFSAADTCADVEVWIDLDWDGQIVDTTDSPLFISVEEGESFCDGDEEDEDEMKNGSYKILVNDFFPLAPAQFIFKVIDSGGEDAAILELTPLSSPYMITGAVVNPPDVKNLVVAAEAQLPYQDSVLVASKNKLGHRFSLQSKSNEEDVLQIMTLTDSTGAYSIGLPYYMPLDWAVYSWDMFMQLEPSWIPPEPYKFYVDKIIENVDFKYQSANSYITGNVLDENGMTLMTPDNEPFDEAWVYAYDENSGMAMNRKIMPDGTYILPVMPGKYSVGVEHEAEFFMLPHEIADVIVNDGDSLVDVNFKLYHANSTISGYVMSKEQEMEYPWPWIELFTHNETTGYARNWTNDNGYYELYVSDQASEYKVEINTDMIPYDMAVEGSSILAAAPGDADVNFYLIKREINEAPFIEMVEDVPNDQGRQVRVSWKASDFDQKDSPWWDPIESYGIWRGVPESETPLGKSGKKIRRVESVKQMVETSLEAVSDFWFVVQNDTGMLWDFVMSVPAVQMDRYAAVVPTLGDSTETDIFWSQFVVSAHTMDVYRNYFSEIAKGYSVDNLKPPQPIVIFEVTDEGVKLAWDPVDAPDIVQYNIYRSQEKGFTPQKELNLLATTTESEFLDKNATLSTDLYYRVEAQDDALNRTLSGEIAVSSSNIGNHQDGLPTEFSLSAAYPNPFNASTKFVYEIPKEAYVTIRIYNLIGEEMRTLVKENKKPGIYQIFWDGRSNAGNDVASGVYIYEMTTPNYKKSLKMTLLR